ncbi:hypothetical protein ABAC460_04665 [Asticcacaulis sp. AC460]|uniref:DUF1801 domain-containing protein n=1 Tax=Asticcacaulis sp. AC460 TaxID=1282360 RepID=UPI0003C402DF|nr:DUF1801 domain-containing protein [Asticcacaulis sp. AC460]ESQ92185.1 hypothetical protein ABAC460_04665 [Asticcacaulis sp. AC460]
MPNSKDGPKTKPTDASAVDYLTTQAPENRRADGLALLDLFTEVTGEHPVMWGESIVGFGRYTYTNTSKKPADWPLTGFSPRKAQITIYIMTGYSDRPELVDGLGKFTARGSCLYFKKLADLDRDRLKALIKWGYDTMKLRYKA